MRKNCTLCPLDLTAAADDGVNYDRTEEVGAKKIRNSLTMRVLQKHWSKDRSFDHLYPEIHVDKQKMNFNPTPFS